MSGVFKSHIEKRVRKGEPKLRMRLWAAVFVGLVLSSPLFSSAEKILHIEGVKFPQHFRLTLQWEGKIPYQVEQSGEETIVIFDRDAVYKEKGMASLPSFINHLETKNIEGSLVTKIKLKRTADLKYSWLNGHFVIDIYNNPLKKEIKWLPKLQPLAQTKGKKQKKDIPPPVLKVSVTGYLEEEKSVLVIDWEKDVKGAIVQWGEGLFIVFDQPALFELIEAQTSEAKLFRNLCQLDFKGQSVLRLSSLSQAYRPLLKKEGTRWILEFPHPPFSFPEKKSTPLSRTSLAEDLKRVIYSVEGDNPLGDPITFEDPETGYLLCLLPGNLSIHNVEKTLPFDILPSVQGIALLLKNEGATVKGTPSSFEVTSPSSLFLSSEKDLTQEREPAPLEPLISFPHFSEKEQRETLKSKNLFHNTLRREENSILQERGEKRQEGLLTLAKTLLAKGYARESLDHVGTVLRENPSLLSQASLRALRFLGALLEQDKSLVEEDIQSIPLRHEPEYPFFKALSALLGHENAEEAFKTLSQHERLFQNYPLGLRIPLIFVAAAIADKTHQSPERFLALLQREKLSPDQQERYDFYQAKVVEREGDLVKAFDLYKNLEKAKNLETRVNSRLGMVSIQLKKSPQARLESIKILEELTSLWRGGETEFHIFQLLGTLYGQEGAYRKALVTLRSLYRRKDRFPQAKELYPQMATLVTENIVKNTKNSPLEVVTFYEDFKAFVSQDHQKNLVWLKVTEAYIQLDLLEQAEGLLRQCLKEAQESDIRQKSVLLLAEVYNRDKKFKKALETLEALSQKDLEQGTKEKKFHLTFSALLGLNLYDQAAEQVTFHEHDHDVTLQKLELAWKRKEWKTCQNILSSLIYGGTEEQKKDDGLILNCAIASFFNEDADNLEKLRDDFSEIMKETEDWEAFELLTEKEKKFEPTKVALAEKLADMKLFEKFMKGMSSPPASQ